MNIKDRLFTYPVLSSDSMDFINSTFAASYDYETLGVISISFKFRCQLENTKIIELINQKKARLCVHIECSLTSYRKMFDLKINDVTEIKLDLRKINGRIEMISLVVATEDIFEYYSEDFNEDYENRSFYIDKGSILAYASLGSITINKNIQEFKNVESIFTITKLQSEEETPFSIDLDSEKIKIGLPQKQFEFYNLNCNNIQLQGIFNSLLVLPSLIFVFETLTSSREEYSDKRWYIALEYNFKKLGRDLVSDLQSIANEDITSNELAQIIMDYPIKSAFECLSLLEEGDDSDED